MPTYYVLADSGFGTQAGANRTIIGYPDGAKIPEVIKKKVVRLHFHSVNDDKYFKTVIRWNQK